MKDTSKNYIVPTQKWLIAIEPLITNDTNTSALIMIGQLINKEKVIVKITKDYNKKIMIFSKKLNNIYNFVKTYCSFACYEDYTKLKKKYKNENYFCNEKSDNIITLEIMKKYNGSIKQLVNKLSREHVCKILSQLLFAQLEAFYKYGFIHEDISSNNILYTINNKNVIIDYELISFRTVRVNLDIGDVIPIISDYDKSESYKNDIYSRYNNEPMIDLIKGFNGTIVLLHSLTKTIQCCIQLINNTKEREYIRNKTQDIINSPEYEKWYRWTYKSLKDYTIDNMNKNYDEMVKETYVVCRTYLNKIMKICALDNKYDLIPDMAENF